MPGGGGPPAGMGAGWRGMVATTGAYSLGDRDGGQTCIMASCYVFFKTFPCNAQGFMVSQVDGLEVVLNAEAVSGFFGLALEHFPEVVFAGNVLAG